jgi:heme-degrading monooxygenase HmoA
MLSLSYWCDEQAVAAWRPLEAYRMAPQAARGGVFADYRLRVAQVLRDYGMTQRLQVPADSGCYHGTDKA